MSKKKDASEEVANLLKALVEDVELISDDELMSEIGGEDLSADVISERVAAGISRTLELHGKATLARAQESVRNQHTRKPPSTAKVLSLDEKRAIVARFAEGDDRLNAKLTMAARNGDIPTESDLDSILQDLWDLGVVGEVGDDN